MDLFKAPGIAETLDWAEALLTLDRIALDPHTVADTLGVLLKYQDDVGAITKEVAERLVAEVQGGGHRAVNPVATRTGATMLPRGFLADNVLHFVRVLRAAGLPVGPAKVIDAIAAVEAVGVANKTDFREALAAVLVSRHEQLVLFEQAFDLFWRNPKLLEKMVAALLPRVYGRTNDAPDPPELPSRLAQAMLPPKLLPPRPDDEDEVELDAAFTFSPREVLQAKDFATMTADELAQVKAMLARLKLPLPELPVRRTRAAARGHRIDLRATLRGMTGAAGAVAPLAFRARIRRTPPLVVLCDISGSMDRYAQDAAAFSPRRSPTIATACTRWCSARASPTLRGTCGTAMSTSRWSA